MEGMVLGLDGRVCWRRQAEDGRIARLWGHSEAGTRWGREHTGLGDAERKGAPGGCSVVVQLDNMNVNRPVSGIVPQGCAGQGLADRYMDASPGMTAD